MNNNIKDECAYHVNGLYICEVDINTPVIEKMSNNDDYNNSLSLWNQQRELVLTKLQGETQQRPDCSGDWGDAACKKLNSNLDYLQEVEHCCIQTEKFFNKERCKPGK